MGTVGFFDWRIRWFRTGLAAFKSAYRGAGRQQKIRWKNNQVNDMQVMLNHCVRSTAGIMSLPDRRFKSETWEDTSGTGTRLGFV